MDKGLALHLKKIKKTCTYRDLAFYFLTITRDGTVSTAFGEILCRRMVEAIYPGQDLFNCDNPNLVNTRQFNFDNLAEECIPRYIEWERETRRNPLFFHDYNIYYWWE